MAKNQKKLLSILVALSMCTNILSMPAKASETTGSGTTEDPYVTESGSGTAEDPHTQKSEVIVNVSVDEGGSITTTTTTKEWTGDTATPGNSASDGGTDIGTLSNTTTSVTGSETTVNETLTDGQGNVLQESGSTIGQQTTTTTQEWNDVLIKKTESTETEISSSDEVCTETIEGEWNDEDPEWTTDWTYDKSEPITPEGSSPDGEGFIPGDTTQKTETTSGVQIHDPLGTETDSAEVTINMTPCQENYTKEEVYVTVWDILDDNTEIPAALKDSTKETPASYSGASGTNDDGSTWSIQVVGLYDETSGRLIGYKEIKTTTSVSSVPVEGEVVEADRIITDTIASAPEIPDDWDADAGEIRDADNNVIGKIEMTKEPILDDNSTVIGYTITKITTTYGNSTVTGDAAGETTTADATPVKTIELPEKPKESETTAADGTTTTTTVEYIYENGNHVGYRSVTVVKDSTGKELSRSSKSIYGTSTTKNSTTTTDPVTQETTTQSTTVKTETTVIMGTTESSNVPLDQERVTDTETTVVTDSTTYQLVGLDDKLVFIYQGKMYAVTGTAESKKEDVVINNELNSYPKDNDLSNDTGALFKSFDTDGGDKWKLTGYGLVSNFKLYDNTGTSQSTKQFLLTNNGECRYVYAVELGTSISFGHDYSTKESTDTADDNSERITYGSAQTTENGYKQDVGESSAPLAQLRSVATNGFWGAEEGLGSLEAVKDLMRRNGLESYANQLTAGHAVTATQAAIYTFGNPDYLDIHKNGNLSFVNTGGITSNDRKIIESLYDLLVTLAKDTTKGQAEKITANSITAADITLNAKEADTEPGNDGKDHDVYKANVGFTLAVSTSSINGDLIVRVIQDGKTIATRRLAGDDSQTGYGKIYPDKDGHYTIEDLQLTENLTLTLNLSGTQHLDDGIYVYNGVQWQDFIGLTAQEQSIDLSVNMEFTAEEPDADILDIKLQTGGSTAEKSKYVQQTEKRTGNYRGTRTNTTTSYSWKCEITTNTSNKVYADVTVSDVVQREWRHEWNSQLTGYDKSPDEYDDGSGADVNESVNTGSDKGIANDNTFASPPTTGDTTLLVLILSILSCGGLAGINLSCRRKEEEA